jgi:hypothetical protein
MHYRWTQDWFGRYQRDAEDDGQELGDRVAGRHCRVSLGVPKPWPLALCCSPLSFSLFVLNGL